MLKGFKDFLLRGNVVDLAVAVVIGTAFAAVIKSVVDGLIGPLIAAIGGSPDLDNTMTFVVNGATFSIGLILTAVINFIIVAAAIYFVIVLPMKTLMERTKRQAEVVEVPPTEDIVLLTEIRDLLRTQQQRPLG